MSCLEASNRVLEKPPEHQQCNSSKVNKEALPTATKQKKIKLDCVIASVAHVTYHISEMRVNSGFK